MIARLVSVVRNVVLGFITYLAIAIVVVGDAFRPIALVTFWSDRLGAPHWGWIVVACCAFGALLGLLVSERFSFAVGPIFVSVAMIGSLLAVGAYANHLSSKAFSEFRADRQVQSNFFVSVRHAPEDFQFFLHGAAMKRCTPYAWSYRTMSFYHVPRTTAVNVMPVEWLRECAIQPS